MKLTIFAATGGIGRQLLEQAVAAGHDVAAVVRNPHSPAGRPALSIRRVDVLWACVRDNKPYQPKRSRSDQLVPA